MDQTLLSTSSAGRSDAPNLPVESKGLSTPSKCQQEALGQRRGMLCPRSGAVLKRHSPGQGQPCWGWVLHLQHASPQSSRWWHQPQPNASLPRRPRSKELLQTQGMPRAGCPAAGPLCLGISQQRTKKVSASTQLTSDVIPSLCCRDNRALTAWGMPAKSRDPP